MLRFADFCAAAGGRYDKLAFVYDVRVGEPPENLTDAVAQLRARTKPAGKPDKAEAKKAAKSRKERKD